MNVKKLISVMAAAVMLCGCTSTTGQGNAVTEYKTMAAPENGWTVQELASVMYLDGVCLEYPCCLKDFGEEYTYPREMVYSSVNGDYVIAALHHASLWDNYIALVEFKDIASKDEVTNETPYSLIHITTPDELWTDMTFSFNGITFGCTEQEFIAAMGEPSYANESTSTASDNSTINTYKYFQYDDRESGKAVLSVEFANDELISVLLDYNGENDWQALRKTNDEKSE